MPSQASPVPPPAFVATSLPAAAPRGDLTAQRSTRRVTLTPKYGAAPCEVDVEVEPELEPESEVEPDMISASARFVAERAIKSAVALSAHFIFFS